MPPRILNPKFPADPTAVATAERRLRDEAPELPRPVVILAGWRAPALSPWRLEDRLRRLLPRGRFLSIAYPLASSVQAAADAVVARLERAKAARSSEGTLEIDVVAISMGGLVARWMLAEPPRALAPWRLPRLFTLATPHRGAKLANYVRLDEASRQMRPGSDFLDRLHAAPLADTSLTCYAMLRDWWVGARNAAPPDRAPLWIDAGHPLERALSHFLIVQNRAVTLDLALRLAGQPPLAAEGDPPPID